jgi:hypothetical protein
MPLQMQTRKPQLIERAASNMAAKNTASAQERKGTTSTKASLINDNSLRALLDFYR